METVLHKNDNRNMSELRFTAKNEEPFMSHMLLEKKNLF